MKRILIVDDEKFILTMLRRALETEGVEVVTASTLEDTERRIDETFFDLIITDIRLTGVLRQEGLEILDYARGKSPETQVIVMTGYRTPQIEQEAYARGAYHFFDKPIELGALNQRIEALGIKTKLSRAAAEDRTK